jgi:hypothetical protein
MIKKNLGGFGRDIDTSNYRALAAAFREAQAIKADFQRNVKLISDAVKPSPPPADSTSLAAQIVRAAAKARCEIPPEPPPADSVAGKILAAGRRRRGEEPTAQELAAEADVDTPAVALARKIVEAGRRRRGEIK